MTVIDRCNGSKREYRSDVQDPMLHVGVDRLRGVHLEMIRLQHTTQQNRNRQKLKSENVGCLSSTKLKEPKPPTAIAIHALIFPLIVREALFPFTSNNI